MRRVASSIIEVKDGSVVNYHGNYEYYLHMVNQEIDEAEFARTGKKPVPVATSKNNKASEKDRHAHDKKKQSTGSTDDRAMRKEITQLEKTIARLDDQKRTVNEKLMQTTDPMEAMKLHDEVVKVSTELEAAEMRWAELQELIEEQS
jgi:ATP-binding cassette subfamily F protein 3